MLAFLLPALIVQQATVALAPDAEARWIPFALTPYNQLLFAAELDGKPVRAVLDTGVSDTVVTSDFARSAGLAPGRRSEALAIGGTVPISWATARTLRIGALTRSNGRVGIMRSPQQARIGADMLVGADVLGCCALDIDFARSRFRILPSGRMPFTGSTGDLQRGRLSGVYVTSIRLGGKRLMPIIVDTGDGASLTLDPDAWQAVGYRGSPVTTTLGWGAGGPVVTDTAIVPGLAVAGTPAGETEVRIEPRGGFLDRAHVAGRIGASLLMRYRVLLDPAAGRMILKLEGPARAVPRSTSGLLMEYASGALRIVHVMRGSPGARQGWKAGETICAADGVPIARQIGADGTIEWSVGAPGRTVRLTLCDGAERELVLRRFY